MDDKYVSKLSPTVDFWAGMYLVIIGKYTAYPISLSYRVDRRWESEITKIKILSLHRYILGQVIKVKTHDSEISTLLSLKMNILFVGPKRQ